MLTAPRSVKFSWNRIKGRLREGKNPRKRVILAEKEENCEEKREETWKYEGKAGKLWFSATFRAGYAPDLSFPSARRPEEGKKEEDFSVVEIGLRKLAPGRAAASRHHVQNDESRSSCDCRRAEMGFAGLMILRTFSLINLREEKHSAKASERQDGGKDRGRWFSLTYWLANIWPTLPRVESATFRGVTLANLYSITENSAGNSASTETRCAWK